MNTKGQKAKQRTKIFWLQALKTFFTHGHWGRIPENTGEVAGLTNLLIIVTTYLSKFIRDDKVFIIFIKTLSNASWFSYNSFQDFNLEKN